LTTKKKERKNRKATGMRRMFTRKESVVDTIVKVGIAAKRNPDILT
jgi:hypothetical protein